MEVMMKSKKVITVLLVALLTGVTQVQADTLVRDMAIGASIGAVVGSSMGGRDGAIIGGLMGAAVGASANETDEEDNPPAKRSRTKTYYVPTPVYYQPMPVQVYYQPYPVYTQPWPVYNYAPTYGHHQSHHHGVHLRGHH